MSIERVFSGLAQNTLNESAPWDAVREEIELRGYVVVRAFTDADALRRMVRACDEMYAAEVAAFGREPLEAIGDLGVVRSPFFRERLFRTFCSDLRLTSLLKVLLGWPYILHLQRLVVSDTDFIHPAGVWHREPPYQNFVTSTPIAVTTILSLDAMTRDNGPLFVLESSHKWPKFPSGTFLANHKVQLTLDAGDLLVFDSALFHRNGANTAGRRRSLVTIYTCPLIKQQTDIAGELGGVGDLDDTERVVFGTSTRPFETDDAYRRNKLKTRQKTY